MNFSDSEIVGRLVFIEQCKAEEHGESVPTCVCHLVGKKVTIDRRHDTHSFENPLFVTKGWGGRIIQLDEIGVIAKEEEFYLNM
ncbi:MAG: hypothetical protein NTY33_01680 [Candidatus Moranbacteria bacterium]|nr:hypothetical protein [Candidatus Moranbacteria bacterium]